MNLNKPNSIPIIVDVEASGFGPFSYPIEIGLALDTGEKFCSLIRPLRSWTHWDSKAESVHRISRDVLEHHGVTAQTMASRLNELLQTRTVYTDGWVVDKPWIQKLFDESGQSLTFQISALEMILSEKQMSIWHNTKDRLINEAGQRRHRASFDAYIIQQTWLHTRNS